MNQVHVFGHYAQALTHIPLNKMAAISQTIFSDALSWMKSFVFWLKCHWSLFVWFHLHYPSNGLDNGLSEPMLSICAAQVGAVFNPMAISITVRNIAENTWQFYDLHYRPWSILFYFSLLWFGCAKNPKWCHMIYLLISLRIVFLTRRKQHKYGCPNFNPVTWVDFDKHYPV